jgi:hypothetical protein
VEGRGLRNCDCILRKCGEEPLVLTANSFGYRIKDRKNKNKEEGVMETKRERDRDKQTVRDEERESHRDIETKMKIMSLSHRVIWIQASSSRMPRWPLGECV